MREENTIEKLRVKWSVQYRLSYLLFSFAGIILVASLAYCFVFQSVWVILIAALLYGIIAFSLFRINLQTNDVIFFLNSTYPGLEDSAQLAAAPYDSLSAMQQWQLQKIISHLPDFSVVPAVIKKKNQRAAVTFIASIIICIILFFIPKNNGIATAPAPGTSAAFPQPVAVVPGVKSTSVTITPPTYTNKKSRTSSELNISAEENAKIEWRITTTAVTDQVQLMFNDHSTLLLQPKDSSKKEWIATKKAEHSGFYQLKINNQVSPMFRIELIEDEPPAIVVETPKPSTTIAAGEAGQTHLKASVRDDYGIDSFYIHATTASGSGEAVSFKELTIPFADFKTGIRSFSAQKTLQLKALNIKPGDELYFYLVAKDNHHQEKRSDVYIIRIEDTAELMSMPVLVSGSDTRTELFRSERQIIIETEQLLREKDTLTKTGFQAKSSNLGTDQELLRLRYGKYLGEETETEIGEEAGATENGSGGFGDKEAVLDQYSHKHDIAEDATFFDEATKKQLHLMLDEMWKASLQLKTYHPNAALPFEYNALRLLKNLQQKTRAYVGKTGTKTTPLDPAKRLTGELSAVSQPVLKEQIQQADSLVLTLRKSLGLLEKYKAKELLQPAEMQMLDKAAKQLSVKAAADPATFLSAYESLVRIRQNRQRNTDIEIAGNGIQKLIASVLATPQSLSSAPDMNLSKPYFIHLNSRHE